MVGCWVTLPLAAAVTPFSVTDVEWLVVHAITTASPDPDRIEDGVTVKPPLACAAAVPPVGPVGAVGPDGPGPVGPVAPVAPVTPLPCLMAFSAAASLALIALCALVMSLSRAVIRFSSAATRSSSDTAEGFTASA